MPNVASLSTEFGYALAATVYFVDPSTQAPAATNFVSFDVFDTETGSSGIVVSAFDVVGNHLHTEDFITPGGTYFTVSLNIEGMHRLELSSDPDGNGIDNFVFNDVMLPTSVPTTGVLSITVLGVSFLLLGTWRLQRANE